MPPKLILAFDTSAAHCAVALVLGDRVLADVAEPMTKGQAEQLFPLIQDALASAGHQFGDLDAIGVGIGPGNFTGIRISVSAARGLALACKIPAIGVSRLAAMAHGSTGETTTVLDARRGRIYVQDFSDGIESGAAQLITVDEFSSAGKQIIIASEDIDFATTFPNATQADPNIALATADLARAMMGTSHPRPAPLYLRDSGAAISSDPAPVILE